MSATVADFRRKKAKLTCTGMPTEINGSGCRDELMEESELEVVRTEVANYKHLEGKKKRAIFEDIDNCTSDMLDAFLSEAVHEMKILEMENLLKRFQHRKYFPRWRKSAIGVHHILQAIRGKTVLVAVHKLVSDALLTCSSARAKSPPYNIYMYSLELANKHGAAEVRVEHLAIAAVCLGVDMCYEVSTEGSAMKFLKSLDANSRILPESSGLSEGIQEVCDVGVFHVFSNPNEFYENLLKFEQNKL
ncbi:hypothetical protein O6P43_020968 [Quillaja saponaria]|uniref:Uncharacterized protein n=1 Tax=Quillaja saponaria TaxID=32244 RepID=A0AAD7LNG5_QUISA|nr:hypothetical protein O6P43_020968 [Quillaja saponaria]